MQTQKNEARLHCSDSTLQISLSKMLIRIDIYNRKCLIVALLASITIQCESGPWQNAKYKNTIIGVTSKNWIYLKFLIFFNCPMADDDGTSLYLRLRRQNLLRNVFILTAISRLPHLEGEFVAFLASKRKKKLFVWN